MPLTGPLTASGSYICARAADSRRQESGPPSIDLLGTLVVTLMPEWSPTGEWIACTVSGRPGIAFPRRSRGDSFVVGGVTIASVEVWTFFVTLLLTVVRFTFFRFSRLGIALRAVAQNRYAALLMGIRLRRRFEPRKDHRDPATRGLHHRYERIAS